MTEITNQTTNERMPGIRKSFYRLTEVYLWILFGLLISLRFVIVANHQNLEFAFREYFWDIIIAVFVTIFPFLHLLIFSEYPLERIRNNRVSRKAGKTDVYTVQNTTVVRERPVNESESHESAQVEGMFIEQRELGMVFNYAKAADYHARKIYNRSGAYLLIGCLIAFAGVLYFGFATAYLHPSGISDKEKFDFSKIFLESYLPRIGTLIFVETIAFFFLKQYRITMEDFRYYEAIKRQRENQYVTLQLLKSYEDKPDLIDKVIDKCAFNENPNRLNKEDTTQFLEAAKLASQEGDIIDKLVEIIKVAKK